MIRHRRRTRCWNSGASSFTSDSGSALARAGSPIICRITWIPATIERHQRRTLRGRACRSGRRSSFSCPLSICARPISAARLLDAECSMIRKPSSGVSPALVISTSAGRWCGRARGQRDCPASGSSATPRGGEDLGEQLLLRAEIAVDQHGGDACPGGDLAHAGSVIAGLAKALRAEARIAARVAAALRRRAGRPNRCWLFVIQSTPVDFYSKLSIRVQT